MKLAHRLAQAMRRELDAVGVNLRQNSGSRAGQDVMHFHLHVVPHYADDTVLPGCVWGEPPWQPPTGGEGEGDGLPKSSAGPSAEIRQSSIVGRSSSSARPIAASAIARS
jgi:hypothetical protein